MMTIWKSVKQAQPAPHAKYLVRRDGGLGVATPCYGMHAPWWVPATFVKEYEPSPMRDDDEWTPLS